MVEMHGASNHPSLNGILTSNSKGLSKSNMHMEDHYHGENRQFGKIRLMSMSTNYPLPILVNAKLETQHRSVIGF